MSYFTSPLQRWVKHCPLGAFPEITLFPVYHPALSLTPEAGAKNQIGSWPIVIDFSWPGHFYSSLENGKIQNTLIPFPQREQCGEE